MLTRLRAKFVCINMLLVTVMLCVILSMVLHFTKANLETQSIQMMRSLASSHMQPGRPGEPTDQVQLPYFILQFNPKGELIGTVGGYYDLSDVDFLQSLVLAVAASPEPTGIIQEHQLRFYFTTGPYIRQIVFADISSELYTIQSLTRSCLFIGILSFLLFLVISLLLAHWAVKPVATAWNQQRQFVADASHELKTPLTVILTNAELLEDPGCTEENRSRFIASIQTMSHQMRGLVEGLLELARADNRTAPITLSPLDLSQLVSSAALPFEAVFFEKDLPLTCSIENGIFVKGSDSHLRQVVDILLDNAQKYSLPCAPVELVLCRTGRSSCQLQVATQGDPLSKDDLKNIFKRFYRMDKARTMCRSYGLGLPIAQSIVASHKGRIWAESHNGTNTFFVQLPIL